MSNFSLRSNKAFTLIEILIVLSVLLVLITISITTLPKYLEKREMESFLKQFSKDVHYTQSYAVNHQTITYFLVDVEKQTYAGVEGYSQILFTKRIPKNITISYGSLLGKIYFSGIGNVSDSGSWYFRGKKLKYQFTVLLGRGRHYYNEQ